MDAMIAWAHGHGLRVELAKGDDGQLWAQLDGGPVGLQHTSRSASAATS